MDEHASTESADLKSPTDFSLIWKEVNYKIYESIDGEKVEKKVLNNINGCCNSREITAIMGPSGAGKIQLIIILTLQ